jgi:hypothetical protein
MTEENEPGTEIVPIARGRLARARADEWLTAGIPANEILRLLDREAARWQQETDAALEKGDMATAQQGLGGKRACQELRGEVETLARTLALAHAEVEETNRDEMLFEPWFRSRELTHEIRRLQTGTDRKRWTVHFDKWGCLNCHRKDVPHGGNGFCGICRVRTLERLKKISQRLNEQFQTGRPSERNES